VTEHRPSTRVQTAAAATAFGAGIVAVAGAELANAPAVAAPLAASIALILGTPAAPAARAGAVLGGYLSAVISGIAVAAMTIPPVAAVTTAAALGTALMMASKRLHPPAVAGACVIALQPIGHWQEGLIVLCAACALAAFVRLNTRTQPDAAAT
jgi:CBS-domain-containing membrane protein